MSDPAPVSVSVEWLQQHLGKPGVQVLDGTFHTPGRGRDGREEYLAARIPRAVFFDIHHIADPTPGPPWRMLPTPERFADEVGKLGLDPEAHIVIYDAIGLYSAARVWWMFRIFGHDKVSVLDGGLPAWKAVGGAIEAGPVGEPAQTAWPVRTFHADRVRNWQQVLANIDSGKEVLVDVRPPLQFMGDTTAIYPGVRTGHIVGAINLSQRDLLHPDGRLRSDEEMRAVFARAGVDVDAPIIASCGSGVTACILTLALEKLRGRQGAVYDGSREIGRAHV